MSAEPTSPRPRRNDPRGSRVGLALAILLAGIVVAGWLLRGERREAPRVEAPPVAETTAPVVEPEVPGAPAAVAERVPLERSLAPGAAGAATGTIEGRIVGTGGRLLPTASLSLLRPSDSNPTVPLWYAGEVENDGSFRISDMLPGTYTLFARVVGVVGNHREDGIEVRSGETSRLEIVVPLGSFVAGRVVDRLGAGAKSRLGFHRESEEGEREPLSVRTQETREDGVFLAGNLEPGRYTVIVRPSGGRIDAEVHGLDLPPDGGIEGLEVVLPSGHFVAGRVIDAERAPVAEALVEATSDPRIDPRRRRFQTVESTTSRDGAFRVEGLEEQPVALLVVKEGVSSLEVVGVEPDSEGIEIVLPPPTGLEGRVVDDATGDPIQRFTVSTWWKESTDRGMRTRSGPKKPFDSEIGRFEVLGLRAGTHEVSATAEGYTLATPRVIEVRAGEVVSGVELRMQGGATIRGVVRNAASGETVEGAHVKSARETSGGFGTMNVFDWPGETTDSNGRFELRHVRAGRVHVRASKEGSPEGRSEEFEVVARQVVGEVIVVLPLGGAVEGAAVEEGGSPLHPALVEATPLEGRSAVHFQFEQTVPTSPDGAFRIERLAPGPYRVTVTPVPGSPSPSSRSLPLQAGVEVFDGETTRVEFDTKPKGCLVRGRVLRDGLGVAGVEVSAYPGSRIPRAGERFMRFSRTDGSFEIPDVPAGHGWLEAVVQDDASHVVVPVEVVIPPAREFVQDILFPAGRIRGRVVRASDGASLFGVRVLAHAEPGKAFPDRGESSSAAFTEEDGRYEITGLVPGEYALALNPKNAQSKGGGPVGGLCSAYRDDVHVYGSAPTEVDFSLEEGATIVVTVTDEEGFPVTGARVFVRTGSGAGSSTSDVDGVARPSGIPPGENVVTASHPDFAEAQSELIAVRAGETEAVSIVLRAGVRVDIRVRAEPQTGPLVPRLEFVDDRGRPRLVGVNATAFEEGLARSLVRLLPGTYTMRVTAAGFRTVERPVEIGAGPTQEIEIRLEPEPR